MATICTKIPLTLSAANTTNDGGFCWKILPFSVTHADNSAATTQSTLQWFENGVALGPPHSAHDDIRNIGHGRFSHWSSADGSGESIRFSASDNSNPLTNGKAYSYCLPVTVASDATSPLVTLTAPVSGDTVIGAVTVAATPSDNVGVVGVQFKLDGANLGAEKTAAPWSASWDSKTATNAAHVVSAVARDAAGNTATVIASITVSNVVVPPPPPKKTLLYGWINERWLAATLARWANSGFGGFMIAGQVQWFTPSSDLDTYNRASFTALNAGGAQYGITDNFPIIALTAQNWADSSYLPAWSDNTRWAAWLTGGLTTIANFARTTGCKGIVFDTENYTAYFPWKVADPRNGGASVTTLQTLVYQRGQQMMQAMQAAFPSLQIILIQEGGLWASQNDANYQLWPYFYNGLASVQQTKVVIGSESSYPEDVLLSQLNANPAQFIVDRAALLNGSMTQYAPNWAVQGSLAIGMRPLGVSYSDKSARYTPDVFKAQLAAAKAASGPYVWVYSHGSAWWQMTAAEITTYGSNPWHYTADPSYQVLAPAASLPTFFNVVNGTY